MIEMRLRYLLPFLILFTLIAPVLATVQDVQVSPRNPQQGDTISVHIFADPNEEIELTITFDVDVPVQSGSYVVRFNDVEIPDPDNVFSVETRDVKTLNIAASFYSLPGAVINKVGTLGVNDIIPGTYDIKISGYAEDDEEYVTCIITAWTKLTVGSDGEYILSYNLGNIPPGEFTAHVERITKFLTISPKDTAPPEISGIQPLDLVTTSQPIISASFSDSSEIDVSSVVVKLDSVDVTAQSTVSSTGFTYQPVDLLNNTNHQVQVSVNDIRGNAGSKNWGFNIQLPPIPDTTAPTITNTKPIGVIQSTYTTILANLNDNKLVDTSTVSLKLNELDITSDAQITQNSVICSLADLQNNTLYNVLISAQDRAGNVATMPWSFTVVLLPESPTNPGTSPAMPNSPPKPSFSGSTYAILGESVQLDASTAVDPDGIITSYFWDFGDGNTKNGPQVTHKFQTSGEKTITLTVTDNRGSSISTTQSVTIYTPDNYTINVKPGTSRTVFTGQRVTFDGSQSTSLGGIITQFWWDMGDSTINLGDKTTHIYSQPGLFNVTLTITDQRWTTKSRSIEIEVIDPPISPSFQEEAIVNNGTMTVSSELLGISVTVSSSGESGVLILEYPINPYPSKPLPSNSVGLVKDISIGNPDSVEWPVLVEIDINSALDPVYASRLGIFWFNGTEWSICQNTGYNITTDTVWAFMTREETSGSPIIPAVQPTQPDIFVTSITVDSQIVDIRDVVIITVNLENNGDLTGVYTTDLIIGDDKIPFSKEVKGHNSSSFFYVFTASESGEFTVSVDSIETTIEVEPYPADFYVVDIDVLEDPLYTGEIFSVNARIGNQGDSPAENVIVQLKIDESVFGQETVQQILPDEEKHVIFQVTLGDTTEYSVTCIADPENSHLELDETNNEASISIELIEKPTQFNMMIPVLVILLGAMIYLYQTGKLSNLISSA